jgi:hypothetical protein
VQRHFRKTISKSALYPQPTAAIQTGMEVAPFPLTRLRKTRGGDFMMEKLFFFVTAAGLLCGYVAMIYAVMYIIILIDHSYFQSLAM